MSEMMDIEAVRLLSTGVDYVDAETTRLLGGSADDSCKQALKGMSPSLHQCWNLRGTFDSVGYGYFGSLDALSLDALPTLINDIDSCTQAFNWKVES